jgi:hypothetical protein
MINLTVITAPKKKALNVLGKTVGSGRRVKMIIEL